MAVDILDVWILDSAAGNRNLPHIRLLPFFILAQMLKPHTVIDVGLPFEAIRASLFDFEF